MNSLEFAISSMLSPIILFFILEVILPALSAIFMGVLIATLVYFVMSKVGFDSPNAGSIAGHYGACSSVTLTTVLVFLEQMGLALRNLYLPSTHLWIQRLYLRGLF